VRGWVANGFPGPNAEAATSPALPDAAPVPGSVTAVPDSPGAEVAVSDAPASVSPPIDDDEYSRRSNAVHRVQDDVAMKRAEKELLIVSRDLDELKNPKAPAPVGTAGDVLAALIGQQTVMMQGLLQMVTAPKGPDPIEQATRIIAAFRESTTPVDLGKRPEGQLYNAVMTKMVDRIGDRLFEPESEGGGNLVIEVAKVLAPIVGDIIRSRAASVPVTRADSGGTIVPALPDTSGAPSRSIESLGLDPVPALPAPNENAREGGGVGFVEVVGDVFEVLLNLYVGGVPPEDAVQTLYHVIGSTPHPLIVRMMKAPVGMLKVMAIGCGVSDVAQVIDASEGKEWVLKVQAGLADIYSGKGGDPIETSPL